EADLEARVAHAEPGVDRRVEALALQHLPEDRRRGEEGEQHREDRGRVRLLARDAIAAQPGDEGAEQRCERGDDDEVFHPLRVSRSSTSIVLIFLKSTSRMASPIADSAAATVRMKKTNTCPATLPRKCEKAMKFRFTARSISSIAISSTIRLRRLRKMPTTLIAKRMAASTR